MNKFAEMHPYCASFKPGPTYAEMFRYHVVRAQFYSGLMARSLTDEPFDPQVANRAAALSRLHADVARLVHSNKAAWPWAIEPDAQAAEMFADIDDPEFLYELIWKWCAETGVDPGRINAEAMS